MAHGALFAGVLVGCLVAFRLLTRARWTWRSPRVGIVCWQAVGLTVGLSAIGAPLACGLAPYHAGTLPALIDFAGQVLTGEPLPGGMGPVRLAVLLLGLLVAGWLIGTTISCLLRTLRVRRRHRQLLSLVGRLDPAVPGALVLDHPGTAAYCLPGVRPQVVVSAGALTLLDRAELAAVLSHEQAHAAERHDLVLLPFSALCRTLPAVRWLRPARAALYAAHEAVALLIEMRADDSARRVHTGVPLAAALMRFAAVPGSLAPPGTLGATGPGPDAAAWQPGVSWRAGAVEVDAQLQVRLHRLLVTGPGPPWVARAAALATAIVLVAVPVSIFLGGVVGWI